MKLPFTHGIVRHQTDNQQPATPTYLLHSGSGGITLNVLPDPLILAISHRTVNYLITESALVVAAWPGPFIVGTTYYLFVDIDKVSAARSFGQTTLQPIVSSVPPATPVTGQHWYDLSSQVMKVYDSSGVFVDKLRVFVGELVEGSTLVMYPTGSTVGLHAYPSIAGSILFDNSGSPLRKITGNKLGEFFTTETNFNTQTTAVSSVSIEGQIQVAQAVSNIAAYQCVSYNDVGKVTYSSNINTEKKIDGIVLEDLVIGDQANIVTTGVITNPAWNWVDPVGKPVFCDATGQLTTVVPTVVIQTVGHILSPTSIKLNIGPKIVILD